MHTVTYFGDSTSIGAADNNMVTQCFLDKFSAKNNTS